MSPCREMRINERPNGDIVIGTLARRAGKGDDTESQVEQRAALAPGHNETRMCKSFNIFELYLVIPPNCSYSSQEPDTQTLHCCFLSIECLLIFFSSSQVKLHLHLIRKPPANYLRGRKWELNKLFIVIIICYGCCKIGVELKRLVRQSVADSFDGQTMRYWGT